MSISNNRVVVALKIPVAIAALIALAQAIVQAMTNNKAIFVSPTPPLTQVTADTDALVVAETATKARTKGSVPVRDDKRKVLVTDLRQLQAYAQKLVDLTPEQGMTIAEAAGMTVKKKASHNKSPLAAKLHLPNQVQLVAKANKGDGSHEWQYSTDGKVWTSAATTTQAKTVVTGLQSGVLTYFRHRAVTKTGASTWSEPVSMMVA